MLAAIIARGWDVGGAPCAGMCYFNTTAHCQMVWNGSGWDPGPAPHTHTYTSLTDTPASHTARAVPFTNATANALAADAQFYYNDSTKTLYVQNLHTNDHIFANGWRIVEDWDRGGLIIMDHNGRKIKRIGPGLITRIRDWFGRMFRR